MKNFQKFLEEITIKGHPSIPGEGPKKDGDKKWIEDVERRAKTRLGITPQDAPTMTPMGMMPSQKLMRLGREIMPLVQQSANYIRGKETELAELAEKVIRSTYDEIIKRYEIELDIKIIQPRQMKQFMDEGESEMEAPPEFKEVTDNDIRNEVFKRKIANLIIQGEAKNTKHILHSDEVKEGLEEIYGDTWKRVFDCWDQITKIADQLDWIIPTEARAEMMEQQPEHQAGAVKVDWKPKEQSEDEDETEEGEGEMYFGGEDEEEILDEGEDEPMENFGETPVIKARGIDFPMLLHETVKGLFEILSIGGIPEDKRTAQIAFANTGLADEPEDWKYGVEIAADLRDFINKNPDVDKYPNIREEVYKMMIDKKTMPTAEFLELMRGILNNTDKARTTIDRMVSKVITMIKSEKGGEEQYQKDMDEYNREMEEYQRKLKEWEEQQAKGSQQVAGEGEAEEEDEISRIIRQASEKEEDYSEMTPREIQELIDDALGEGDYDKVKELSKYLKEGKEIYLRDLEVILENKNPHMGI